MHIMLRYNAGLSDLSQAPVAQHCINGDSLSQWRRAKCDPSQNGDHCTDRQKFGTVDYAQEATSFAKFRANPSTGGFSANA